MMKDFVGTVLFLHSLVALILNRRLSLGFMLFVGCLGCTMGILGTYLAVFLQQKRLIEEIKTIESADLKEHRLHEEEPENSHLGSGEH